MPELCKSLYGSIRFSSNPEMLFADTNKLAYEAIIIFHVKASPKYRVSWMITTSSRYVAARTQANVRNG